MLWLYRLLFPIALAAMAPQYLLRMRRRGGYAQGFAQRFGTLPPLPARRPGVRRIWLHAVSVGEVLAVAPLIEELVADGRTEIYLSSTTSTGHRLAHDRWNGSPAIVGVGYFPLDWVFFSARAWRGIAPDVAILTEGERWPEHLHQGRRRGVPVVSLNARVSDRSFRRMGALRFLVRPFLSDLGLVLAASELDAARFRALGVQDARIEVTGNIKLDVRIPLLEPAEAASLRAALGFGDAPILLGSSTWPGEEAALLAALRECRAAGVDAVLLLVPRHAERRSELEGLLEASGLAFHFRSRGAAGGRRVDVAVADTTGELRRFLQLADLVFIGKSLPPHTEGQTPVEAAALGKPLLMGPGRSNFRQIAAELEAAGALGNVSDAVALGALAPALLRDPARLRQLGAAAAAWHRANQGAVGRSVRAIRDLR